MELKRSNALVAILLLILAPSAFTYNVNYNINKVVVYGSYLCPTCRSYVEWLKGLGLSIEFRETVGYDGNRTQLVSLMNLLDLTAAEAEIIAVVLSEMGEPIAVVIGEVYDENLWIELSKAKFNGTILIVHSNGLKSLISSEELASSIKSIVLGGSAPIAPRIEPITSLLIESAALGLLMAVNPCAISTLLLLTFSASAGIGGLKSRKLTYVFIAGVFTGYNALGLASSYILYYLKSSIALYLVLAFAALVISVDLVNLAKGSRGLIACYERECIPGKLHTLPKLLVPIGVYLIGASASLSFTGCAIPALLNLAARLMNVELYIAAICIALFSLNATIPLLLIPLIPVDKFINSRKFKYVIMARDIALMSFIALFLLRAT